VSDPIARIEKHIEQIMTDISCIKLDNARYIEREKMHSANITDLQILQKRLDNTVMQIQADKKARAPMWVAIAQFFITTSAIVALFMKG
jgi:hypothetical protein